MTFLFEFKIQFISPNENSEVMNASYPLQSELVFETVKRYIIFISKSLIHYSQIGGQQSYCEPLYSLSAWKKIII